MPLLHAAAALMQQQPAASAAALADAAALMRVAGYPLQLLTLTQLHQVG
jgi:hypothetical protein